MKRAMLAIVVGVLVMAGLARVSASGPLGVYAIVEKVAFEPNESAPQRIRITGAFAYVNEPNRSLGTSAAKRGYMYFKLPDDAAAVERIRREWADIKAVAGTGQAIGFGNWFYVGGFGSIQPDVKTTQIIENSPRGGSSADMRVRAESEAPGTAVTYQTNAGVVKLSADGSNANIVSALKAALGLASATAVSGADTLQLIIGQPFAVLGQATTSAAAATLKQNAKNAAMAVRVEGCGDPAALRVTASGEGIVGSARRTVPLTVVPVTTPAAFTVSKPMDPGAWVVTLQATCGKLIAGAIVPLIADGIDRERSTFYERAATATEIDKAVKANATAAANRKP